jgi:LacI family transcriptional regulator
MSRSPRSNPKIPRVALLVETTRSYTRELLSGVRRYIAEHGPWSTFIELRALDSSPPPWLRSWDGDGIISRTFTPEMAKVIADSGIPAVEVRSSRLCQDLPFVGMDNRLIGRTVAQHFYTRGYRQFATYSLSTEDFFEQRVQNFVSTAKSVGCPCVVFPETEPENVADWEQAQGGLMAWLEELPKPIGIFAANDQLGVRLLDACQRAGIAVPEEVAVVGAENEETLCEFATPSLSSLRFDGTAVGYAAAEILAKLMEQQRTKIPKETLIPPRGLVTRASSDDLVIHDSLVARAVRLMRENAAAGITVDEVCRRVAASRSTLERRMKQALDRTPKEEIQRLRFRQVEQLLRQTDLTIEAIAQQTGFTHSHYLQAAFRERHGMTPGQYRTTGRQ